MELEDIRKLLIENDFEEINEDNYEEKMEYFYTPFQLRQRLKIPLEIEEFNMAIQYLGLKRYYEGFTIPSDPEKTAFMIKEKDREDPYIQIYIKKNVLQEIKDFIYEDENFNNYLKKQCEDDFNCFMESDDFIIMSSLTSGPSENFSHIIKLAFTEIKNGKRSDRQVDFFVDNNLSEKQLKDYVTPYEDGKKSPYELTGIALPKMIECNNESDFIDIKNVLRSYYKICKDKIVISDDIIKQKNFIKRALEDNGISEEYGIDKISKRFISLRRLSKYIFNEYYTIYELAKKLKYKKLLKYGAIGESKIILDLLILLKENKSLY